MGWQRPGRESVCHAGGGIFTLRTVYAEWPFFRTTLDNAVLSLARTDLEIAVEYAAFADDEFREAFFLDSRRSTAARSTCTTIGRRERLHIREWLAESTRRRNPSVDPLNLLQVGLLSRSDRTAIEERTLRLTIRRIVVGMKKMG